MHDASSGEPNVYAYVSGRALQAVDLKGLDTVVLHGGGPGGPDGAKALGEHVRRVMLTVPLSPRMDAAELDSLSPEFRPKIDYDGILNNGSEPGVRIAEGYRHSTDAPRILAGFSIGGDAALRAGRSEDGGRWDLRVVVGARVDDKFLDRLEKAAENSERVVVVGIKGDTNMANDGLGVMAGSFFGDRSYEGIMNAVRQRYGSYEKFAAQHSNVTIEAAEGAHAGGGNRQSTLDAVTRGVGNLESGRANALGPIEAISNASEAPLVPGASVPKVGESSD